MPIISDSGRKDSVGLSCTPKAQERCWSSCAGYSHAAEAGAVSSHPAVTEAQIQGCKTLTTDSESPTQAGSEWWSVGVGVAAFLGEMRCFFLWLMRRNCILGCLKLSHTPRGASVQDRQGRHAVGCPALSTAKWPLVQHTCLLGSWSGWRRYILGQANARNPAQEHVTSP